MKATALENLEVSLRVKEPLSLVLILSESTNLSLTSSTRRTRLVLTSIKSDSLLFGVKLLNLIPLDLLSLTSRSYPRSYVLILSTLRGVSATSVRPMKSSVITESVLIAVVAKPTLATDSILVSEKFFRPAG